MIDRVKAIEELKARTAAAGDAAVALRRRQEGRLNARERVLRLVDPGSFVELEGIVRPNPNGLGSEKEAVRGDGLVAGYGMVHGGPVVVWSQDATVQGGRVGLIHGKKMVTMMERAIKARVPCIGIIDSEGLRLDDFLTTPTNYGYDRLMFLQAEASGVIPQVSLIMGPCTGAAALSSQLSDFVFMVRNTSYLCVSPSDTVKAADTGSAWSHARTSGCCDVLADNDEDCLAKARELLSFLPWNNCEQTGPVRSGDGADRVEELLDLVPSDPSHPYSMHRVISLLADGGRFFEYKRHFASNLITGLSVIGSARVGIVANNPQNKGGCLDVDSADKMARFVRFCDAFNIPLIWLTDTPAFLPAVEQEIKGIIRHGSKVVFANSNATVPRIGIYIRKSYGGGNLAMPGNVLGGDAGIAWPTSEIFLMWPEGAVAIIYRKEIEAAVNKDEELKSRVRKFREESAVGGNWEYVTVQDFIDPRETRRMIIKLLQVLAGKREERYGQRHDNVPL